MYMDMYMYWLFVGAIIRILASQVAAAQADMACAGAKGNRRWAWCGARLGRPGFGRGPPTAFGPQAVAVGLPASYEPDYMYFAQNELNLPHCILRPQVIPAKYAV